MDHLASAGISRFPELRAKTDKGLPKYQDDDKSDVFIFSGTEDFAHRQCFHRKLQRQTAAGVLESELVSQNQATRYVKMTSQL